MRVESPVFSNNESIPVAYTCDGKEKNPPFQFFDVPTEAKSLVLIVDDPDAPGGDFVHWLVWNIDPRTTEITEASVPPGAIQGTTDFGTTGYGGPCPPSGTHRYQFKLYALDTSLSLPPSTKKSALEAAMKGYVLTEARLVGLYKR